MFSEEVDPVLKEVCLEIAKRYEIVFIEIGVERDHVHFLPQSVPSYSPKRIVKTGKSITAREIFKRVPAVKKQLWGGEFWTKGCFMMSTVGRHGDEDTIKNYLKNQGKPEKGYKKIHSQELQLELFYDFDTS